MAPIHRDIRDDDLLGLADAEVVRGPCAYGRNIAKQRPIAGVGGPQEIALDLHNFCSERVLDVEVSNAGRGGPT